MSVWQHTNAFTKNILDSVFVVKYLAIRLRGRVLLSDVRRWSDLANSGYINPVGTEAWNPWWIYGLCFTLSPFQKPYRWTLDLCGIGKTLLKV
jgi:hypothetical protein